MKTELTQTVNVLTIESQLRVEGSNNYHFFKKSLKDFFFFKTRFKIFSWLILARCVRALFSRFRSATLSTSRSNQWIKIEIDKHLQQSSDFYRLLTTKTMKIYLGKSFTLNFRNHFKSKACLKFRLGNLYLRLYFS